jgi:2-phosphosulfolactate phosphatase
MACEIEVLFTPAEFRSLHNRDLSDTACVVFDVLRATSTIVTALAAGAAGVLPVGEISEALAWQRRRPDALLAGERGGQRIGAALTGGPEFDLGNSPREFTAARVGGKFIVATTTNGTRALRACAGAAEVVVGSFLNLGATARHLGKEPRGKICIVCAGTGEEAALEDALAAGALCRQLESIGPATYLRDSSAIARGAFLQARHNLADAIGQSRNARQLMKLPEFHDDVAFCARLDAFPLVAKSDANEVVRRLA